MSKIICSLLIPSRFKPDGVLRMIESGITTAASPDRIEFVVRLHDDDFPSLERIPEFCRAAPNVRVVVGPTGRGYSDLSRFFDEAAAVATGDWILQMGDDAMIGGDGWDSRLDAISRDKIVLPEFHQLNRTVYHHDFECSFPIVPAGSWLKYADRFPDAPDTGTIKLLRSNGWDTEYLAGCHAIHLRDVSHEQEKRREECLVTGEECR